MKHMAMRIERRRSTVIRSRFERVCCMSMQPHERQVRSIRAKSQKLHLAGTKRQIQVTHPIAQAFSSFFDSYHFKEQQTVFSFYFTQCTPGEALLKFRQQQFRTFRKKKLELKPFPFHRRRAASCWCSV